MRAFAPLLLALGAAGASASQARGDELRVTSPRPDSVSVTIYRDFFALVTETRTVDLPEGPVTLVFDGVVESLLPQSAVITDTGRTVRESNYDYDVLYPEALLRKAVGREVQLTRTNPATGKVRQLPARLVAAGPGGVLFETLDGTEALHCSGLPEKLSFEEVPGDLSARPTLSVRLDAGSAGKRQVRVSYLAHGFGWSADYVGNLGDSTDRMDLRGWITLHNLTHADFRGARVQVVAGRLNLLDHEESRGTSLLGATADHLVDETLDEARLELLTEALDDPDLLAELREQEFEYFGGCYPLGPEGLGEGLRLVSETTAIQSLQRVTALDLGSMEIEEIVVTGFRMSLAVREKLADYQMYRLPEPTDLAARQTKQVAFLHKPDVKVEKFYGLKLGSYESVTDFAAEDNFEPLGVRIAWQNRESDGLGEPLPAGIVAFFDSLSGATLFAGSDRLDDTSTGAPVELSIAHSVDVGVTLEGSGDEPGFTRTSRLTRRAWLPVHLRVYNDKPRPVLVEIRQEPLEEFLDTRITDASVAPKRKGGDYVWRFEVPAHGEQELSYRVGGRAPDWMLD